MNLYKMAFLPTLIPLRKPEMECSGTSSSLHLLLLLLLLLLFMISSVASINGESETHYTVGISSLVPSTVCSPSKARPGSSQKVFHRHGPCSPLPGKKLNPRQILTQDQLRVNSLQTRVSTYRQRVNSAEYLSESALSASYGASYGSANYVVTVGFGTPQQDMTVIFDTGSDLTWIQCQPCVGYCHSQKDPIFNPSKSSSYVNISCNSADCVALVSSTGGSGTCSGSTCVYGIQYGDQSYSVGFFGTETLRLTQSDSIPNLRFGCGEKNRGLFGSVAGLLGLGRDKVSLVSQTDGKFAGVFSYCLTPPSSSSGYLSFGGKPSPNVRFTPLVTRSPPSFYFLDMVGIIVGAQKLAIDGSVFSNAGTVIDSGTVITRLPPAAYSALRSSFRQAMSKYPTAPALSILDTCYNLSGNKTVTIPKIRLQFPDAVEISVDLSGILYGTSTSQICLAFAGNSDASDVGIFGNSQQRTYEVVYDAGNRRVGFGAGGCR